MITLDQTVKCLLIIGLTQPSAHAVKLRELLPKPEVNVIAIYERQNDLVFEKVKGREARDLVKKLKDTEDMENAIAKNLQRVDKNAGLNKILVKRIVPSNYETPSLEYDYKYNTYFKPIMRVHKKLSKNERYRTDKSERKPKNKNDDYIHMRDDTDDVDGELLVPFQLKFDKKEYNYPEIQEDVSKDLLKHINSLLKKVRSPRMRQKAFIQILDALNDPDHLRTDDKSGEALENDPLLITAMEPEPVVVIEKPSAMASYTPFFNYWTYQKTVYEDECSGEKVRIGNVCSRIPPHRRWMPLFTSGLRRGV